MNWIRYALAAAMLLALLAGCAPAFSLAPVEPRTIVTTGDAEVRVVPDEVILTLGVETSSKQLAVAKQTNDERVQAIIAAAQSHGVRPQDIQTEYLHIEPRYRDSYEQRDFIGYFVRRTIVLTLEDIEAFEGLLGSVLESGANYIHGIEFRTTELRRYRDEARALAVQAAREKAAALAGELGQRIGAPQAIQEEASSWFSGYSSWWGGAWGGVAQNVIQNAPAGGLDSGTLAPGQIAVRARVSVTFALR